MSSPGPASAADEAPWVAWSRAAVSSSAGVAALCFLAYCVTTSRAIYPGDSPELVTAAWTFGIPHPPGYPLYTLITGLWTHALAPLVGGPAFAANLSSAGYAAVAAGLAAGLLQRLRVPLAPACTAALAFGLGRGVWSQSVMAEVYTFDLMLLFSVLHLAGEAVTRRRFLPWFLLGLVAGAWIGHRPVNLLYALPLGVFVAGLARGGRPVRREALAFLGGVASSLLVFLFLPIRSATQPYLDTGDPSDPARFLDVVTAQDYRRHLGGGVEEMTSRVGLGLQGLPADLGPVLLLAAAGVWFAARSRGRMRWCGLALIGAWLLNLAFSSRYQVLDVHVYFLPGIAFLTMLAGLGARSLRWGSKLWGGIAALSVLVLVVWNGPQVNVRGHDLTEELARETLESVGPNGVLFARGDNTEPGLYYLQAVEGLRPDVVIVDPVQLAGSWWYAEVLRQRHPEVDWPPLTSGAEPPVEQILERLLARGPAHRMYGVPAEPFNALVPREDSWVPHGPAYVLEDARHPSTQVGALEHVSWALEHCDDVDGAGISEHADAAVRYLHGYLSLCLFQNATLLAREGMRDERVQAALHGEAVRLFRALESRRPDEIEAALVAQHRRCRTNYQPLELGRQARQSLAALASLGERSR